MTLEQFDIQGNILRGYRLAYAGHLFLEVGDADLARAWLATAVGRVTTAEVQARSELRVACNIGVSAAGLERLNVPPALRAGFSPGFQLGMARRSEELGDGGPSHPVCWTVDAFYSRSAHLVVSMYAHSAELRQRELERLQEEFDRHGLKVRHAREVERRPHEHFGFADGLANPDIDGARRDERRRPSSPTSRPLPAGEFLLGYRDLEGVRPAGPPGSLGRNGTYMVYREFEQDVAGFRRLLRHYSATYRLPEDLLAAKIVGRWRNGTPLAVSPDDDRLPQGRADPRFNDFGYAGDTEGFRCPLGSHIRRANPRDSASLGLAVANRHRMIRRGMPYGPELPGDALSDDGDEERGLAFICFVGSIERQFEFVLREWCNDGNAFGLGAEGDFLIGTGGREATMTINGTPPIFLTGPATGSGGPAPLVRRQGGEYFYLPGIAGLRTLAQGTTYD